MLVFSLRSENAVSMGNLIYRRAFLYVESIISLIIFLNVLKIVSSRSFRQVKQLLIPLTGLN